jgi:Uma2 family endonuclease
MSTVPASTWPPNLTPKEAAQLFMLFLKDDTEDAPWMSMGDLQFWSASSFAHSLRNYAHAQSLGWYVASLLPIWFTYEDLPERHQLSPDVFVAFVPEHPRSSFDVAVEGKFPPFVLEVVSPSSEERDQETKRKAYELLEVREYALFTPRASEPSSLEGYRLTAEGTFKSWQPDAQGRLWSEVLGLFLVVRGRLLQAETADGRILLTPEQTDEELQHAEAEIAQLRQEIERYRRQDG